MKCLIGSAFIITSLSALSFAAEMPDSCRKYIAAAEQMMAHTDDERRNRVLIESIATIRETLQMLDEKRAALAVPDENVPHAELMLKDMNKKILKRLSQTCAVMYRQMPSDLTDPI